MVPRAARASPPEWNRRPGGQHARGTRNLRRLHRRRRPPQSLHHPGPLVLRASWRPNVSSRQRWNKVSAVPCSLFPVPGYQLLNNNSPHPKNFVSLVCVSPRKESPAKRDRPWKSCFRIFVTHFELCAAPPAFPWLLSFPLLWALRPMPPSSASPTVCFGVFCLSPILAASSCFLKVTPSPILTTSTIATKPRTSSMVAWPRTFPSFQPASAAKEIPSASGGRPSAETSSPS